MLLKSNEVNQIEDGTIVFQEHEEVTQICIILKGHIMAMSRGSKVILSQGSILGIPDLYIGHYLCSYVAYQDAVVYLFPVESVKDLIGILAINKDYHGLMVYSLSNHIKKLCSVTELLRSCADSLYSFLQDNYKNYENLCIQSNHSVKVIPDIMKLEAYATDFMRDEKSTEYYIESSKIPLTSVKEYYSNSVFLTMWHVEEAAGIIASQMIECVEIVDYIEDLFQLLLNAKGSSLFTNIADLVLEMKASGKNNKEAMEVVDLMVDEINRTDLLCERNTNCRLNVNRKKFEEIYCAMISGSSDSTKEPEEVVVDQKQMLDSMMGSLQQIIKFSKLEKEKGIRLTKAMNAFAGLTDRLSAEGEVRDLRKEISTLFFELYEAVFKLAHVTKELPLPVNLFLNYAFLDERLLTKEQLISLCKLSMDPPCQPCNIYTIREWLTLVYEGKREPSKNEFDLDYIDFVREQKKHKVMTAEDEKASLNDQDAKLHFEIMNMFFINDKVVNGQFSTFVPCLYKELFLNWPEKEFLTRKRLNDSFQRILSIDYSAFYRETMYVNLEAGIEKEYIVKCVYPDIILLPMVGSSASMWQEISQKKRTNPGRFIFPIFLNTNIDDNMIRMFGRFRWELCRSVQGTAWNNLKHKSLTSEYMDYLQFYKKNHELTEDRKEKLKLQIQKARNNSREVFVIDYEAWIKNEASGAIRLNKVARELLATYCPFSKEIRTRVLSQPLLAEAFSRFQRDSMKKVHGIELRIRTMQKANATVTKEIEDTLRFYKEM